MIRKNLKFGSKSSRESKGNQGSLENQAKIWGRKEGEKRKKRRKRLSWINSFPGYHAVWPRLGFNWCHYFTFLEGLAQTILAACNSRYSFLNTFIWHQPSIVVSSRLPWPCVTSNRLPYPCVASSRLPWPCVASSRLPWPCVASSRLPWSCVASNRLPWPWVASNRLPWPRIASNRLPWPRVALSRLPWPCVTKLTHIWLHSTHPPSSTPVSAVNRLILAAYRSCVWPRVEPVISNDEVLTLGLASGK